MTLQRIRLQSRPPLPAFRVWFLIPEDVTDIRSLKLRLCTNIPALKKLDIQHTHLDLEIDEFELLDYCAIALVHEGDVITVKRRDTTVVVNHGAQTDKSIRSQKRPRLSSSSEDSTTSASTSSSESSSDSSTESYPDADDPRSRPSHPLSAGSKSQSKTRSRVQPGFKAHVQSGIVSRQQTVPPGLGKASTQSRNRRRRIRRKLMTAESARQETFSSRSVVAKEKGVAAQLVSDDPQNLFEESPERSRISATEEASLSNARVRNGKKNVSVKEAIGNAAQTIMASHSTAIHTSSSVHPSYTPTFIPPSERKDLPKNIFITSVEVEWRTEQQTTPWEDTDNADEHALKYDDARTVDGKVTQPIDWDEVGRKWDNFPIFDTSTSISSNTIVAWKAFGLDPVTLTPQASILHLGKVVSLDMDSILIQPLTRPDVGPISFGRSLIDEDQESALPVSLPIEEVRSNDWRVIIQQ